LGEPAKRERLAEHRGVLQKVPLGWLETIQASCDQRVQGLGNLERLNGSRDPVLVILARQHATVEQHPDRLDRVERHALRPLADPDAEVIWQPGHKPA
jgi:hypothetical protein